MEDITPLPKEEEKDKDLSLAIKFFLATASVLIIATILISVFVYVQYKNYMLQNTYEKARIFMAEAEAARRYVKEVLRPKMYSILPKDKFIVEAMSTSYVTRKVMGKVASFFRGVRYKRAALNPRNPGNEPNGFEREMIAYYNRTHSKREWHGIVALGDRQWFVVLQPIYMEKSCLRCHGNPRKAPAQLIERYGRKRGFFKKVGSIAGLDEVQVPVDKALAAIHHTALNIVAIGVLFVVVLFVLVGFFFQKFVYGPLTHLISFCRSVEKGEKELTDPITVYRNDEIGELTISFIQLMSHLSETQKKLLTYSEDLEALVLERTKELKKHQAFLETVLSKSPIGFLVVNEDGIIRFWNKEAEEITGVSASEIEGKRIEDISLPLPLASLKMEEFALDGPLEHSFVVEESRKKYILINSSLITDDFGNRAGIVVNFVDITEMKRLHEELNRYTQELESIIEEKVALLRQSEKRYREIFEHANDAIVFLDSATLEIIDANPKWLDITGYPWEEVVGRPFVDFFRIEAYGYARECLTQSYNEACTLEIQNKRGNIVSVELISSSFWMDNTRYTMSILRDITARCKLEEELLSINAELKRRNKELQELTIRLSKVEEESRRKFADILHNQLGQDLTAIKINIGMLKKRIERENVLCAEELAKIDRILAEVISITRDLTAEMYPTILDNLGFVAALRWYMDFFQEKFPITTSLEVPEPVGRLPQEVETLLFRLVQEGLLNCAKHANATEVKVIVRMEEDGEMVLKIIDNGEGFSFPYKGNTSRKKGMGLHMIRERVSYLGGNFTIHSQRGIGTVLEFHIPLGRFFTN